MTLVKVSENVLINPLNVNAVEMKIIGGEKIVTVFIGNRSYEVKVPIEEFLRDLQIGVEEYKQHWAG